MTVGPLQYELIGKDRCTAASRQDCHPPKRISRSRYIRRRPTKPWPEPWLNAAIWSRCRAVGAASLPSARRARSRRHRGAAPPVALQQQRSAPTTRSSVGSVRTLSNLLRMLSSRAGDYPAKQPLLSAEAFSPNTPEGARGRHFKSDSSSYSSRGAGDHRDLVWQQGCSRRSGTRRALGKGELQAAFRQIRTKDLRPTRGRRSVSITDLTDNPSDTQLYPVRLSSSPCPCREPRRREEPRAYWLSDRAHRRQGYRIPSRDQP